MKELEDEEINPERWNQKELLKHVYRELMQLKSSIENAHIASTSELNHIRDRLIKLENFKSNMNAIVVFLGGVGALTGIIIGILELVQK